MINDLLLACAVLVVLLPFVLVWWIVGGMKK